MSLILINEDQVKTLAKGKMSEIIVQNRLAFSFKEGIDSATPDRLLIQHPRSGSVSLYKPSAVHDSGTFGLKVVGVFPNNTKLNLSTVPGTIMLFDEITGSIVSVVAATFLTGLRTAAGSASIYSHFLNEKDSSLGKIDLVMAVFGSGLQAEQHIEAFLNVNPSISKIIIANRSKGRALDLVERLKTTIEGKIPTFDIIDLNNKDLVNDAVKSSNIIITATNSSTPVFDGSFVQPNTFIAAVGAYTPAMQEIDEVTISKCTIVIDSESALKCGDLAKPLGANLITKESHVIGTAGEVLRGETLHSKINKDNIILFKSVGTAIQDIVTANYIYLEAKKLGQGTIVPWV